MTNYKLNRMILVLLLLFSYAGFLFTYSTILPNSGSFAFTFPMLCCTICLIFNNRHAIAPKNISILVIFAFIFYLVLRFILAQNFGGSIIMLSLLVYLGYAGVHEDSQMAIPLAIIKCAAVFFAMGVFFQMLMPSLYNDIFLQIIKPSNRADILLWSSKGYFAGFTHQIGTTATYICYGIIVLICDRQRNKLNNFLLVLLYIAVFFTGKRLMLMLSVIVPVLVNFFMEEDLKKKMSKFMMYIVIAIVALYLVKTFSTQLINIGGGIGRIVQTMLDFLGGNELDEHRSLLRQYAIDCFKINPIFGVGWGNYIKVTGSRTLAHNAYLQLLAETGIVGVFLFIMMLVVLLVTTFRLVLSRGFMSYSAKMYLKLSLANQLIFIINSFFENTMSSEYMYGFYFIFIAIPLSISISQRHDCCDLKKDKVVS